MKTKELICFYNILFLIAFCVISNSAYSADEFGLEEYEIIQPTALAKPIPLIEEAETAPEETASPLENIDPNISYYVQNLNLSPEQLNKAKEISETGLAQKAKLLQRVQELREEAYKLEAGSLIAFESILTDTQKATFYELRNNLEGFSTDLSSQSAEEYLINATEY